MARKKRTAPGDNTAPAVLKAPASPPAVAVHYLIIPAPPAEVPPAGSAATDGERDNGSIPYYADCPYCLRATPHTLAQHTAAIMRQPGPRPQR